MKPNLRISQGKATVQHLISVARWLFSERGYSAVSTEDIVQAAGVTRGALYHHFFSKKQLFLAAFEDAEKEIAGRIEQSAATAPDLWIGFISGCRAFLEACMDPRLHRIVIVDAPAVLGWETWRRVDAVHGMSLLKEGLRELMRKGKIKSQPVDALAHLLSGAMNEAALMISQSARPKRRLEEIMATLEWLLSSKKRRKRRRSK